MGIIKMNILKSILLFLLLVSFSRGIAEDPPIVYLTWQHSPESTMTIHWITALNSDTDLVEYHEKGDFEWLTMKGNHVRMPENFPYWIHGVELTHLKPNTDYVFRLSPSSLVHKFRTMPSDSTKPVRFAVGGDFYHDGIDLVIKMNKQVSKYDPAFVIAGGDLAYSNGDKKIKHKPMRWLEWLSAWYQHMITNDGRMIPIVPLIGNHDVDGGFGQPPSNAPFFYSLFSFPGPQGYQVLDFGNFMSLIVLDSEHTHPVAGTQTEWLKNTLEQRQHVPHKFAAYHVAAYPSVRNFNDKIQTQIRKNWSPLFEKYGVNVAFENHDHAYKRSKPIRNGKVDPKGVIYIGDGGWSVEKPRAPRRAEKFWYLAKTRASRNAVLVTIQQNEQYFIAINDDGQIIDGLNNKTLP
jgi:hypothetical protein